jgi:hypothetical protein
MRVLLCERELHRSSQPELYRAMNKAQYSSDRLAWDNLAADALELARQIPPGPERNEALKLAGLLRSAADVRGIVVPKRGRPRN